jgi:RND family efflux transporter MFP subunit
VRAQQATLAGAENDARLARELADQRAGPEIDAVIKGARRDAAKADVARAQADLADAKLNLEYSTITAPIDGRITKNYVDIGNLVGRGEPTLLATIVQATPAFVSIDASESDVLAVRRGREKSGDSRANEPGQVGPNTWRPVELALADEPEFNYKGRVDYVEPQMNPLTGTLRVRTRFENPEETLLPGLFARVRFPISSAKAVLVPESALLSDQQGRYALVVNDKNHVVVRRVRVGTLEGTMRVVEEGLTPQDRVVVLGVLKARPGAVVAPKLQEPPADGK